MCNKNLSPKVLVVSHNAFSPTGNMGKTLSDMLSCVDGENLAQLFFHNDKPHIDCKCKRYYRITDVNMVKSVFSRKGGYRIYTACDIEQADNSKTGGKTETPNNLTHKIYQFSRRRTPFIYTARNLLWNIGVWDTKQLDNWISSFSPDVIFFACGDYAFAYKIVYKIAKKYNIPVVPWCCDDFYLRQLNANQVFQKLVRANLTKWAKKVFSLSHTVVTISDKMARDYAEKFGVKTELIRISAPQPHNDTAQQREGIYYIGNLGVNRITPLTELAKALHAAQVDTLQHIHVYSAEKNEKTLQMLQNTQGIVFHGAVPAQQVAQLQAKAKYLLHVEAFDQPSKNRTRYSLSTKIGEYLASGACVAAFGPGDIASMEYLNSNGAALFSCTADGLVEKLAAAQSDAQIYTQTVKKGLATAQKHHSKETNTIKMEKVLSFSCGERE